jgi:ketosteroid isomerase-like protein
MRTIVIGLACLVSVSATAFGQNPPADEKAIRDIVTRINAGEQILDLFLPDSVVVVGSMVKPVVGFGEPRQFRPGASTPDARRHVTSQEQIVQLHIAASGDVAYEYSTFKQSWVRNDNNQKVEDEGALLRAWRKVDGRWRIGAQFRRPNDHSPTSR